MKRLLFLLALSLSLIPVASALSSNITVGQSFINFTANVTGGVDSVWMDIDGINTTRYNMTNTTADLYTFILDRQLILIGNHNVTYSANDTAGAISMLDDTFIIIGDFPASVGILIFLGILIGFFGLTAFILDEQHYILRSTMLVLCFGSIVLGIFIARTVVILESPASTYAINLLHSAYTIGIYALIIFVVGMGLYTTTKAMDAWKDKQKDEENYWKLYEQDY